MGKRLVDPALMLLQMIAVFSAGLHLRVLRGGDVAIGVDPVLHFMCSLVG